MVLLLGAVMAWELFARSAIPVSFDGTVRSITVKDEHPGTRNAWFVTVGSSSRQVDRAVGQRLTIGDRVQKDAWSRDVQVNGATFRVELSREAKAALWFVPALVLISVGTVRLTRRR